MYNNLNSLNHEQLIDLAFKYRDNGKLGEAEEIFREGMERYPFELDQYGHPRYHKELIRMLVNSGMYEKALSYLPKKGGVGGEYWHNILFARAYSSNNDKLNSESWWKKVLEHEPRQPEAKKWLFNENGWNRQSYPQPFQDIRSQCSPFRVEVIFDVGANDGESCLSYSEIFPEAKIYAFEPVPKTFEKLTYNVRGRNNIHPINMALGDTNGEVHITARETSTMNRIMKIEGKDTVKIKAERIEKFCASREINGIDFLKIDTEGFDLSVIKGCGEFIKNISFIQCEASANSYNKFHNSFIEIFQHMTAHSFFLFSMHGQCFEWGNGGYPVLRRFDPVFINKNLVGDFKNVVTG